MDVDDLARAAAPRSRKALLHRFEFLDGMAQVRAYADYTGVAPHEVADGAQQVIDMFVVRVLSRIGGRLTVRRSCCAGFLPHRDPRPRSKDHALEQRVA